MICLSDGVCRALRTSGLLPEHGTSRNIQGARGNLLPYFVRAWEEASGAPGSRVARRLAQRRFQWLEEQACRGAHLSFGFPSLPADLSTWLGHRLVWWPAGIPQGRWVALVSSRLKRRLDLQDRWFTAFHTLCRGLDRRRDVLLAAPSTTTGRFVERAGVLFGLRVLRLNEPRRAESLSGWLRRLEHDALPGSAHCADQAFLSPCLAPHDSLPDGVGKSPLRDRLLVALSERLWLLHLRGGGHLDRLVRARLRVGVGAGRVYVARGQQLVADDLVEQLVDEGAIAWCESEAERLAAAAPRSAHSDWKNDGRPAAVIEALPLGSGDYLTHWTRSPDGPWVDQTEEEFLDELILNPGSVDRSPLASLARIVEQQRLAASARTIRGAIPVVSFTEVPLSELGERRTFRPHRGRWDFEPYGICIRRGWLAQRGTRPVHYGDSTLWQQLAEGERPFFQLANSRSRRTGRMIDWRIEREWRCIGDVDLRELSADDAVCFVPSREEARQLAPLSRWPVMVLE